MKEEKKLKEIEKVKHKFLYTKKEAKNEFFLNLGKMWFMFRTEEGRLWQMFNDKIKEIDRDIDEELKRKGLKESIADNGYN